MHAGTKNIPVLKGIVMHCVPCAQVIIELCSKHLDTECSGLRIDAGPPVPARDGLGSVESLLEATFTSASSALAVPEGPAPHQQPAASAPSLGSPVGDGKGRSDTDSRAASPSQPAAAALPTIDDPGGLGKTPDRSAIAEGEASSKGAARPPLTSATAASKSAVCRRRKSARGGLPSTRRGRKNAAGATATAGGEAMTTCPVCGQNVQADLCSWHLDNDCAGVNPSPAASPVCGGKSTAVGGGGGNKTGAAAGAGSEKATPKKDAGSEATGGLNALAAELTCPVW